MDWLRYVDTGGIVAIAMCVAGVLLKVGGIETKVNAMWEVFMCDRKRP